MIQIKGLQGARDMAHYAVIMLFAGMGIPILAALNAALGQYLGSPAAAAVLLFLIALSTTLVVAALAGIGPVTQAGGAPRHLFLAGVLIAFYVLSVTYIAPHFGVGNAIFFVLIGQLISAAAIDHFGLFGARVSPLDLKRATGLGLMALGVWVTQRA